VIELERVIMPIKAVENFNCPVDQIDTLDFAVDEIYMSQNFAHWIDDVSEIQVARGDFVQHRSEQEKIVLADHGDFKIGIAAFLEFNGGIDAAKSSSDDQDTRLFHMAQSEISDVTDGSHKPSSERPGCSSGRPSSQ